MKAACAAATEAAEALEVRVSCLCMRRRRASKCGHASGVPANAQPDKVAQVHMQRSALETWLGVAPRGVPCHTCSNVALRLI